MATQSPSEGLETPVTVTLTNSSSDRVEFESTFTSMKGFEAEQSFKIRLFISLNSDSAVKLRCRTVVLVTTKSRSEGVTVLEVEQLRKKTSKMETCLRIIRLQNSIEETQICKLCIRLSFPRKKIRSSQLSLS
ncbi:hypothetical protein V8G54_024946 [Vigna mungo]|uniref:Uncharacterized protein n=1 Tax=Vigna mungo TaxID=3915 RepID=A0AAQ3N652_VIGMU